MALTTLAKVQAHLKLAAGIDESLLSVLIIAAQKVIERHCDRVFDQTTHTEYYDGNGEQNFFLDQFPIISVTSINEDAERAYGADTLLVEGTDFLVYKSEGRLRKISEVSGFAFGTGARFLKAELALKIVYSAGYATIPQDLELACNEMVAHLYRNRGKTSNLASQSVGSWSETYKDKPAAIPEHVQSLLFSYVKMTSEVRGMTT